MSSANSSVGESIENPLILADGEPLAFDDLTGFLTRHSLLRLLRSPAFRANYPDLALMKVVLSRFDLLGISRGPERADQVVGLMAKRIRRLFPMTKALIRLGEARFGLLLPTSPDVESEALRLLEFGQRPMAVEGQIIAVRLNIGIALPGDAQRLEGGLMQAAGAALHHAISRDKALSIFHPDMLAEVRDKQALENDLRIALALKSTDIYDAVNNAEFALAYQPIVNQLTGSVYSFEALVRWNHPRLGQIAPGYFIQLAEQIGVMPLLGGWIIRRAMVDAMTWPANPDGTLPRVSINLSARQFDQPDVLIALIRSAISHAGIHPGRVCFEITESNYLAPEVKPQIEALRSIGCSIAIDDFGTGYSALALLVQLPLDYLKIDRSLVSEIDAVDIRIARRARRLLASVIGLAKGLGVDPVIEGVETERQMAAACALGAELIQGHIHHRPMPVNEVIKFMTTRARADAGPAGD